MTKYEKGLSGEQLAEAYLIQQGYLPIDRRFRALNGEIDLIMQDGDTLVFIEVKNRPKSSRGSGLLAVTPDKRRRMLHTAQYYLLKRQQMNVPVRFDVVEITQAGILHVPNAFDATI